MKKKKQSRLVHLYDVLVEYARTRRVFLLKDLSEKTGYSQEELENLFSDALEEVILKEDGRFLVIPDLVRVRFQDFSALFRQKRHLFSNYDLIVSSNVLIFEFFMPLAREDRLREALDNLFYRDTIEQRIREIGPAHIRKGLKLADTTSEEEIQRLVFDFFDTAVGGYSIYMVSGRYRAEALLSRSEAVSRSPVYGPYIIDETTAVVRFIFPVDVEAETYRHGKLLEPAVTDRKLADQAERISWLFLNFFAEAVIRVVHEEEEIFLLESGLRNAFYRWVRQDEGEA
ncbi:MAG: hypothetical protein JXA25_12480 [Anaerolineales bacterium]|nr:hypothetical protein [Anaerolineales bacterium]